MSYNSPQSTNIFIAKDTIIMSAGPNANIYMSRSSGDFGGEKKMKESSRGAASPCAACKLLRRRCAEDCVFAPYFPAEEPHKFASVHKVFGASNVNKMLQELPEHQRGDAVSSMVYEANARVRDPVYGCVGAISSLQQQIDALQTQLALAQAEVVHMRVRQFSSTSNSPDSASPSTRSGRRSHHHPKSTFNMDISNMDHSFWP